VKKRKNKTVISGLEIDLAKHTKYMTIWIAEYEINIEQIVTIVKSEKKIYVYLSSGKVLISNTLLSINEDILIKKGFIRIEEVALINPIFIEKI
jgi:hypothetical protein